MLIYEKELIKKYGIKEYNEGLNRIGKFYFEELKNWTKDYKRKIYNKL